jgi:cbb3-type cytochrome oxidase subunit 3
MPLGSPGRAQEPIHVVPMALALALAAFAGGALGLVWHVLSEDEKAAPAAAEAPADDAAEERIPRPPPTSAPPVGR